MSFETKLGKDIFYSKYAQGPDDTWYKACQRMVKSVAQGLMNESECRELEIIFDRMEAIPAGRYIYYGGRDVLAVNNCFCFRVEDTREDWSRVIHDSMSSLMLGGGIGIDYSAIRPKGSKLNRTGGICSGPISLTLTLNEVGRNVQQGGSRRSAIYGSLSREHADIYEWLTVKDWSNQKVPGTNLSLSEVKTLDFDYPAPLDMTNISVNYGDNWLNLENRSQDPVFVKNVEMAILNGEPGFSFNFGLKAKETLRNAPVSGRTKVLTRDGEIEVIAIVGMPTIVWTGQRWAETVFVKTNSHSETVTVKISNGRSITCSPDHPFILHGWERVNAAHLVIGDELETGRDDFLTVLSVKKSSIEAVYCCDVKVPENSFWAEGVLVSNCCEVTSEDDSDCCNLASVNFARISSVERLKEVTELVAKFLICGTIRGVMPTQRSEQVRDKNRRIGLGIMGLHEWMLKRSLKYEMSNVLRHWMAAFRSSTMKGANQLCSELGVNRPVAYNAIAPNGTIGLLAATTQGIEPLYSTAYIRRYLHKLRWIEEVVIDPIALKLVRDGFNEENIETALSLSQDFERRIKFQAEMQSYIDNAISSTVNLPNTRVDSKHFAEVLSKHAPNLRGLTVYPDGARGGQPIIPLSIEQAKKEIYRLESHEGCKNGTCGT